MSGPKHLWSGDWERESASAARNRAEPAPATDEPEVEPIERPPRRRRPSVRMLAIAAVTAIAVAAVGVVLANVFSPSSKPRHKPEPIGSVAPFPSKTAPGVQNRTTPNGSTGPGAHTQTVPPAPATPPTGGGSQIGPGGSQTTPGGGQSSPGGGQSAPGGGQSAPGGGVTPNPAGGQGQPPTPQFANQPTVQWLGMQIITSPTGAVVNTVQIGSEGDTAGFEPGDVIAAVAGAQINSARQIRAAVARVSVGGHVAVEIARGSTLITLPVTMVDRPIIQP